MADGVSVYSDLLGSRIMQVGSLSSVGHVGIGALAAASGVAAVRQAVDLPAKIIGTHRY